MDSSIPVHRFSLASRITEACIGDRFAGTLRLAQPQTYSSGSTLTICRLNPQVITQVEREGIQALTSQLNPTGDIAIKFRKEGKVTVYTNLESRTVKLEAGKDSSFSFYAEWKEGCEPPVKAKVA